MADFRKLKVWHRSQQFAADIFEATTNPKRSFPNLRQQICKAAASIGANIAEGAEQSTAKHFARYLNTSLGSVSEARSHLDLARRVKVITAEQFDRFDDEARQIRGMLYGLRKRVLEGKTEAPG